MLRVPRVLDANPLPRAQSLVDPWKISIRPSIPKIFSVDIRSAHWIFVRTSVGKKNRKRKEKERGRKRRRKRKRKRKRDRKRKKKKNEKKKLRSGLRSRSDSRIFPRVEMSWGSDFWKRVSRGVKCIGVEICMV